MINIEPRADSPQELIKALLAAKWTQQQIADRYGIERSLVSRLASGDREPTVKVGEALGFRLEVTRRWIPLPDNSSNS